MTAFFFLPFAGPLFWVVVIGLIVLAARGARGGGRDSVRLFEERYARGEITREEFEKLKRELAEPGAGK